MKMNLSFMLRKLRTQGLYDQGDLADAADLEPMKLSACPARAQRMGDQALMSGLQANHGYAASHQWPCFAR